MQSVRPIGSLGSALLETVEAPFCLTQPSTLQTFDEWTCDGLKFAKQLTNVFLWLLFFFCYLRRPSTAPAPAAEPQNGGAEPARPAARLRRRRPGRRRRRRRRRFVVVVVGGGGGAAQRRSATDRQPLRRTRSRIPQRYELAVRRQKKEAISDIQNSLEKGT